MVHFHTSGWLSFNKYQWTMTNKVPELDPREFGELVNNKAPDLEAEEIERKIAMLNKSKLILSVTNELWNKLQAEADFKKQPIEDYCISVLADSLNVMIGKPHITMASSLSGHKTGLIKDHHNPSSNTNLNTDATTRRTTNRYPDG